MQAASDAESAQGCLKEARDQVLNATNPGNGIIALDLSLLIRPPNSVLEKASLLEASECAGHLLQRHLTDLSSEMITGVEDRRIVGVLGRARIPLMLRRQSLILTTQGEPYTFFTPFAVGEISAVVNRASPHGMVLESIGRLIYSSLERE